MERRTFLGLLAAAPVAAAGISRHVPSYVGVDWGAGDATSVWLMRWRENGIVELLGETNRLLEAMPWRQA